MGYMKLIQLNKAQGCGDTVIVIRNTAYETVEFNKRHAIFKRDAIELHTVLMANLPSGTVDELVVLIKKHLA